jgi:hypothetical protein
MVRARKAASYCLILCLTLPALVLAQAPRFDGPEASPRAAVSQVIGISNVTVSYHRPATKGREVWGKLVPYGDVWRAGANENTTITFPHPVTVEGKNLPAGTYGLHMIPGKESWTIIFNKNSTSWGSYFYKESEDALRVTVKPEAGEQTDWLQYSFTDLTETTGVLVLSWEKLRIPVRLSFDTPANVIAYARDEYLRGPAGFTWEGFQRAAQFCITRNVNLPLALEWIDRSISIAESFSNLQTKATLLDKTGKPEEATALREKSLKLATEAEVNILGYNYLASGKKKEAIGLFEWNVKEHPKSWNAFDSLGEGLAATGDTKGAIKNYEKALSMGVSEDNRKRITQILEQLKAK